MSKKLIDQKIDVKENTIKSLDPALLEILLIDQSRKKARGNKKNNEIDNHIIWATDNYSSRGAGYSFNDGINIVFITGFNGSVIKPRIKKSLIEQKKRSSEKAEVFTSSRICNKQNNIIDDSRFGANGVFNKEIPGNKWVTNNKKIQFPKGYTWKDYVALKKIEITCGEAPYMVSRYDVTSGNIVDVNERIGFLDRKIRVINENSKNDDEWLEEVELAFKSCYGYEWQGDSLLIARENLLWSFIDYYYNRFHENPNLKLLKHYAEIISRNVRQMDGLTGNTPIETKGLNDLSKFECQSVECWIKDWNLNKIILFKSLNGDK